MERKIIVLDGEIDVLEKLVREEAERLERTVDQIPDLSDMPAAIIERKHYLQTEFNEEAPYFHIGKVKYNAGLYEMPITVRHPNAQKTRFEEEVFSLHIDGARINGDKEEISKIIDSIHERIPTGVEFDRFETNYSNRGFETSVFVFYDETHRGFARHSSKLYSTILAYEKAVNIAMKARYESQVPH